MNTSVNPLIIRTGDASIVPRVWAAEAITLLLPQKWNADLEYWELSLFQAKMQ